MSLPQYTTFTHPVMCCCTACGDGGLTQLDLNRLELIGVAPAKNMTAAYYVSALLFENTPKWGAAEVGTGAEINFSFMESPPDYASEADRLGFAPLTAAQRIAVKEAFSEWALVANITFTEVSDQNSVDIRLGANNQGGDTAGYAYSLTSDNGSSGDIFIANDVDSANQLNPGESGFSTILHEIGHAIGLKHPGNYGDGDETPFLPESEDSFATTVMSYNAHPGTNSEPPGPGIYDIAAIQYLYGANTTANPGNNTYYFNNTTDDFMRTIYDTGGTDVIDLSNQTTDSIVRLSGGTFSSIGNNLSNNVTIAFNVTLENVIGGSGNDDITGNAASNYIRGGLGNDTIYGGAGTDIAVFSGSQVFYSWTRTKNPITGESESSFTVAGPDGIDIVGETEIFQFGDGAIQIAAEQNIYRFRDVSSGSHVYTASEAERSALDGLSNYQFEGAVFSTSGSLGEVVWRFLNTTNGTHFYTISPQERDGIINTLPSYTFEGAAYRASQTSDEGLVPLYRFFNTQTGSHFFTASQTEADIVEATMPAFRSEGVAFYVDDIGI
ncbi:M10 family metallopeptidase C-terminal domain-containing protein [Thalassobaculum litoreum]|uniref:Serralysin n=1 Tax=Thalassobaculum litoreum DSM 18839 TaxID=1123362 RepID=A0A8G2BML1_9PROT|nr:M10 family metallopeptidase C-terminal domain-containing protein [Thalassobaculum litoreum]SDG56514.1 serralysin [Thalassobaculum litoreum DSM 18839]